MLLYINDNKTVQDLKDRFSKCFPHLKLEIYRESDDGSKQCHKSNLIPSNVLIGYIRTGPSGILDIKSWDKTSKVKRELKELFGLNVQIFRKYHDQWIPATYSDELTLQQQTELAKSNPVMEAQ
ncbi:MAG TPA: hypothetical protein VL095_06560 [Flavisolibacter sp.]|nr:hypothetical protein [Flavisolibacter sp.]